MEASHILLGRPWQSDREIEHNGRTNRYTFEHKGRKTVLIPLTPHEVYLDQMSMKQKEPTPPLTKSEHTVKKKRSKESKLLLVDKESSMTLMTSKPDFPSSVTPLLQDYEDVCTQEKETPTVQRALASPKEDFDPNYEPIIKNQPPKHCKLIHMDKEVGILFAKVYESEEKRLGLEQVKDFYVSSAIYDNLLRTLDRFALQSKLNSFINPREVIPPSCVPNFSHAFLHLNASKIRNMTDCVKTSLNETWLRADHAKKSMPKFIISSFQEYRQIELSLGDVKRNVESLATLFAFSCHTFDVFVLVFVRIHKGQVKNVVSNTSGRKLIFKKNGARFTTNREWLNVNAIKFKGEIRVVTNQFGYGNWKYRRNSTLTPRMDGSLKILKRINNNAYMLDLQGKYSSCNSFNVADLVPFDDETDLRTNPFQVGGDDMTMAEQLEPELEPELEAELNGEKEQPREEMDKEEHGALELPRGPLTRAKAKRLKRAISTLLSEAQGNSSGLANPTTLVVIKAN